MSLQDEGITTESKATHAYDHLSKLGEVIFPLLCSYFTRYISRCILQRSHAQPQTMMPQRADPQDTSAGQWMKFNPLTGNIYDLLEQ